MIIRQKVILNKMLNLKETSIGSWITIGHPAVCEIMSSFNFDWLCFDLEHSSITYSQLYNLIPIIEKNGAVPLVRVGQNDELEIKRALDAGAKGIVVPNISNKEDAIKAVSFCRYQPSGTRGVGLSRAQGYGFKFEEYKKIANKIDVFAIIENKNAIKNLKEIIETKGLSGTLIGPYDLSASYGDPGNFNNKEFINAVKKYEKIGKSLKKPIGFHAVTNTSSDINSKIRKGYKFVAIKLDTIFLGESCDSTLRKINK